MKKSVPHFRNEKEAADFLEQDISDYLEADNFQAATFEFIPKTKKVNLRISAPLLDAIKQRAERASMPYQRYIRQILERELRD